MLDCVVLESEGGGVLLGVRGELTGERTTDRMREWLEAHYIDDGVKWIRLDLRELIWIDLEGAAALAVLLRESNARGKRFTVEGATGQVRAKLLSTGLLGILEGTQGPGAS